MIRQIGNITTLFSLAWLLLLTGTSPEFIHQFSGHQDTIDRAHHCGSHGNDAAFEPEHHHCTFLDFSFSSFDRPSGIFLQPAPVVFTGYFLPEHCSVLPSQVNQFQERGPPGWI